MSLICASESIFDVGIVLDMKEKMKVSFYDKTIICMLGALEVSS